MTKQINFKKVFATFFTALGVFAIAGIFMGAWGNFNLADSRLLERLLFTGFSARLFTDPLTAFRNVGYLFLITFHALLALWVHSNSKKHFWTIFTAITGLIGWLTYLITRREENTSCQS